MLCITKKDNCFVPIHEERQLVPIHEERQLVPIQVHVTFVLETILSKLHPIHVTPSGTKDQAIFITLLGPV